MSPNKQSKRRVLITGGLGFIGSNLAQRCVARGDYVRIVDAMLAPYGFNENNVKEIRSKIDFVKGDIRDLELMKRAVADVDAVVDLAAQVSHRLSVAEPFLDADINAQGALTVLEAVRLARGKNADVKVIYGSTRGVAGSHPGKKIDEKAFCLPTDLNGANKYAAEKYYAVYHRVHGLKTTCLRINNTYGPRGQMRNDDYGVVNWFIRRALLNEPIVIHGDGSQKRDYNYVDDVSDAFLAALDKPEAVGETFWLGSGLPGVSLRAVIDTILRLTGSAMKIESVPRPADRQAIEIGDFEVSIAKIASKLGWKPKTELETGLRLTIDFYRTRMKDYV